jgi:arylsulfatase A-like enzyme
VQRQWLYEQQHTLYGTIDRDDKRAWLRHLDYYWRLHEEGDKNLGAILDALDESGRAGDTAVVFTSDHGDMCGSHGLRSKGPFVYDEIMRVPLYVRAPGVTTAGTTTEALATHVDLARTIVSLAGAEDPSVVGRDMVPVLRDPAAPGRENVLLAQDSAWYESCIPLRYAMRAIFDGRYKYARYYGVGGSFDRVGQPAPQPKQVDVDADFEDHDHELYDLDEDPLELVNLANDRSRRREVREWFNRLRAEEARELRV